MPSSKSPPSPREQLERVFQLLRRSLSFWKRGLIVFILGVVCSVPYVFTRPRDYKSETVILYQETMHSADVGGGEGGDQGARRVGARLRELLLSRQSLEPIIDDLKLFQGAIIHGEKIGAVEEMRKRITFRSREGDTFEISFVGGTPQEAQEVTKRLGDCIIQEAANRRTDQAKALKEFLNVESARNEVELKTKEAELSKFLSAHPEFTPRLQGLPQNTVVPGGIPGGNVGNGSRDALLASMEARAARIERQLKAAQSGAPPPPPKPVPTFVPPPDSAELVAARRDLGDKLQRFTDKHPDVIAARNRLKAAEAAQLAINEAAADQFAQQRAAAHEDPPPPRNPTDVAALQKELESLQNQIAQRRAQLIKASSKADAGEAATAAAAVAAGGTAADIELEFRRLQREVNDIRDRQQKLDERLFRAQITASSVMNDRNIQVSILDPAYLPVRPASKPRTLMLAGLLVVCFLLALGVGIGSAMLDDRLYDRIDIERLDILPVLSVIPKATPSVRRLRSSNDPPG